jgi:hypothetical protein
MRSQLTTIAFALVLAGCHGHPSKAHTEFDKRATQDLRAIQRGDCTTVVRHFDALMANLTAPQLCTGYRTYTEQFGSLTKEGTAFSTRRGALVVVRIPLHLQHANGEYRETYHPDGTVAGLYFLKPGVPVP